MMPCLVSGRNQVPALPRRLLGISVGSFRASAQEQSPLLFAAVDASLKVIRGVSTHKAPALLSMAEPSPEH